MNKLIVFFVLLISVFCNEVCASSSSNQDEVRIDMSSENEKSETSLEGGWVGIRRDMQEVAVCVKKNDHCTLL